MDFPSWDQMSTRDQLLSTYSDVYKEVNGFRPRGQHILDMTEAQLEAELRDLCEESSSQAEQERVMDEHWLKTFRDRITENAQYLPAASSADIVRFMMDADDQEDVEFFLYRQGLSTSATIAIRQELGI